MCVRLRLELLLSLEAPNDQYLLVDQDNPGHGFRDQRRSSLSCRIPIEGFRFSHCLILLPQGMLEQVHRLHRQHAMTMYQTLRIADDSPNPNFESEHR